MSEVTGSAWIGVVGVTVGALFTILGIGISELGHFLRARRAEKAAALARDEVRRAELWQISLPAATRVQEVLWTAVRFARPRWLGESIEDLPSFDEGFETWYLGIAGDVYRDVMMIPSPTFRHALNRVVGALRYSSYITSLGYKPSYITEPSHRETVLSIAHLGLDIVSAWMRDEQSLDDESEKELATLWRRLQDVESFYTGSHLS